MSCICVCIMDCNPGSLFSIPESGVGESVIPGSRDGYRSAEIYQRMRKKIFIAEPPLQSTW